MKKGFTLIELLVVVAIIAILSSVVIASLASARVKSRDARRISDVRQITLALDLYFDSKGYYPPVFQDTTVAGMCTSPPCWDQQGYNASNGLSWELLGQDLVSYIPKLPVDPINAGSGPDVINGNKCLPWSGECFVYAYGNVGRSGVNPNSGSTTTPHVYDLVARLESIEHPLSCQNSNTAFGTGHGSVLQKWCNGGENIGVIYDPSPN
jgi:prepilin-type N-terminal cleavage/methylation domain-containing protein